MKDSEKNMLLRIVLPKMSAYRRDFNETKYMSSMIKKIKNCQKSIMRLGTESVIVLKKDLAEGLHTMKYMKI